MTDASAHATVIALGDAGAYIGLESLIQALGLEDVEDLRLHATISFWRKLPPSLKKVANASRLLAV